VLDFDVTKSPAEGERSRRTSAFGRYVTLSAEGPLKRPSADAIDDGYVDMAKPSYSTIRTGEVRRALTDVTLTASGPAARHRVAGSWR
jgi:hypothetical protein